MELGLKIIKRLAISSVIIAVIYLICMLLNQNFVFVHNILSVILLVAIAVTSGILRGGGHERQWDKHINYVASGEVDRQSYFEDTAFTWIFLNYAAPFLVLSAIFLYIYQI